MCLCLPSIRLNRYQLQIYHTRQKLESGKENMLSHKDAVMLDGIHHRPLSAPNRREHRLILITWDAAKHLNPQFDQLILKR